MISGASGVDHNETHFNKTANSEDAKRYCRRLVALVTELPGLARDSTAVGASPKKKQRASPRRTCSARFKPNRRGTFVIDRFQQPR
jgi:hypothetical protein